MNVKVELMQTSQAILIKAVNAYTKGNLYCVYDGTKVYKFPLTNIFRITEDYANESRDPEGSSKR